VKRAFFPDCSNTNHAENGRNCGPATEEILLNRTQLPNATSDLHEKEILLRRISVADLRVGMFIEEFCGSWMDHPFWRARFILDNETDRKRIRDSGLTDVWINTSKGLDVQGTSVTVKGREDADAQIEQRLKNVADTPLVKPRRKVETEVEHDRAAKIFAESRKVMTSVFAEARLGRIRDTGAAAGVVEHIAESVARHPTAMIGLARLKNADDYSFMHSMSVSALMVALSRTLGFNEEQVRIAGMAGLLHDVGKTQIPASILNKPGNLDEEEWKAMKSHPERGRGMLAGTHGVTAEVLDAVLHHHEKIDGTGYPHRLTGEQISQLAKMTSVCDVYDAVTSDRPYKSGWQPTFALRRMTEWSDGHFDDTTFKAFVKTVGIYPVGSLVRLQSQRLAVVIEQDPTHLLQPTVKTFFSLRSKMHIPPVLVCLGKPGTNDRIVSCADPAQHGLTRVDDIWVAPTAKFA